LLYVLQKLLDLRLWDGALTAALSDDPSKLATDAPREHRSISSL
jgi:hypothetical protein